MFQNPRVVIPGVSSELFSLILGYMYLGEISCPRTLLQDLILLSRHLKIKYVVLALHLHLQLIIPKEYNTIRFSKSDLMTHFNFFQGPPRR